MNTWGAGHSDYTMYWNRQQQQSNGKLVFLVENPLCCDVPLRRQWDCGAIKGPMWNGWCGKHGLCKDLCNWMSAAVSSSPGPAAIKAVQKWWELKTVWPSTQELLCYLALFTMDMVMRQENKASPCKQNIWGACLINDSTASIKRARALWELSDVVWYYCASEVKEAFSVFSVEHRERNLQKFTNNSRCVAFSILNTCFYHFAFR